MNLTQKINYSRVHIYINKKRGILSKTDSYSKKNQNPKIVHKSTYMLLMQKNISEEGLKNFGKTQDW